MRFVELDGEDAETAVAQLRQVPGCHLRPGIVVDADGRNGLVGLAQRQRHERQLPLAGQLHQLFAVLDAQQHEAVDQGALDIPGQPLAVAGRNQRQPGAALVAGFRNALHQHAGERILEEVGKRLGCRHANGVGFAGAQQPAARVGAGIAQFAGGLMHPLAHFRPHQVGPAEDVRCRALRHPRSLCHIAQAHQIACHPYLSGFSGPVRHAAS